MGQPSSKAKPFWSITKLRLASNSKTHQQEVNTRKNSDGDYLVIDTHPPADDGSVSANGLTSCDQKTTESSRVQSNKESVNVLYPPPPPTPPPNISPVPLRSITPNVPHITPVIPSIPPLLPPPPPPPPPPGPTPSTPGHECRRCHHLRDVQKDLARYRAELLTMRTRVDHERALCSQLRIFNVEAQDELISAIDSAISGETLPTDTIAIRELHQKVKTSNQELHEKEEQFRDLETRLSNLDYRFQKKEETLYSVAILGDPKQNPLEDATIITTLGPERSTTSSDSSDLPPVLQEYYDRAGDVTVEWDRLQEFEQDHRRKLRVREKLVDAGRFSEPPEKEFLEEYFEKRAEIVQRYLQAKIDARELRLECTKLNYHIEDHGGIDDNEGELDHSMRFRETQLAKENSYLSVRTAGKPLKLVHYGRMDPQERVEGWLTDSLRARATEAYQYAPWESRGALSEADPEKAPQDEVDSRVAYSIQETTEHLFSTKVQAPGSSRDLRSLTKRSQWRGEILLERRWSNPDLFNSELADTYSTRAHVPRSVF